MLFVGVLCPNNIGRFKTGPILWRHEYPSWQKSSTIPLGDEAISTLAWYHTQPDYPDTDLTSPCHILVMLCTRLGSDQYQPGFKLPVFCMGSLWDCATDWVTVYGWSCTCDKTDMCAWLNAWPKMLCGGVVRVSDLFLKSDPYSEGQWFDSPCHHLC